MNASDETSAVGKGLWSAAEGGDVGGVESALHVGEQLGLLQGIVNYRGGGEHDQTPLLIAAYYNRTDVVSVLLGCAGVHVNAQDVWGRTALMHAANNGNTAVTFQLLERPDLNATLTDPDSFTALHFTVNTGRNTTGALSLLLQRTKIDANARNKYGDTALHYACDYTGFAQTIILLLRAPGIDVNVENNAGWTGLHSAAGRVSSHRFVHLFILLHDAQKLKDVSSFRQMHKPLNTNGRRARAAHKKVVGLHGHNTNADRHGGRGRRGVWVRRHRPGYSCAPS